MKLPLIALMTTAALLAGCNGDKAGSALQSTPKVPEKAITDGTLMTPGTPQVAALPASVNLDERVLPVEWNMWWGENGKRWSVYVDGVEVRSGELSVASPKAQQGKIDVDLEQTGSHEIKIALCNDHGCTESAPVTINVVAAG